MSIDRGALLERERELATLDALLMAARAGRGGTAVIDGEAGVGKSRVLLAARERAEALGMRVLWARGSELEQGFAFGVTRQLLGQRTYEQRSAGPGGGGGERAMAVILASYERLLELLWVGEEPVPILVAVDDAQWADEPSLRFLAHIALRIDDQPVALVVTARAGVRGESAAVLQRLRESPSARVLEPALLSDAAVESMVKRELGPEVDDELVEACARATGGNPFYLSELLRALAADEGPVRPQQVSETAPPSVLRSVVVRLARLGEDASVLARAVAILGDGVSLRLAGAFAGLDESASERAADALANGGILQPGEPLRFLHPLIGSAVEADMGSFEGAREHRRAAELLQSEQAPVERVAAQLELARPAGDRQAVVVLEQAAAHAMASGDPAAAARLLERALAEPPAPEEEARLVLAAAKAELLAGSPNAAGRLALAVDDMGPEERADALAELATSAQLEWDLGRAVALAARARAELAPGDPRQERFLGIELGAAALHPDLIEDAQERLEPFVASARAGRPPSDPRLLALVIGQLGISAEPALVRALVEALVGVDPLIDDSHSASLGWVAAALLWVDGLELAERWLGEAVEASHRRGAIIAGSIAVGNRARARYFCGRLQGALRDAERALDLHRYGWASSPWITPDLALVRIMVGDLDGAREAIAIGQRAGSAPIDHARLLEVQARLQIAEGDPHAAFESAKAVADFLGTRGGLHQPRVWEWRRLAALALHQLGDDERALELLEPDLGVLRAIGPERQLGEALTLAGLATGGRDGIELLSEAAEVLERSPARLRHAETLLALGEALRRAGQRTAARAPLYAALEAAGRMGAVPVERDARRELNRLGLRPRRTEQTGVASLTPSEHQVAELAADGLTTPQIAGRLHITRNTVDTHLRHVYQKLGLSGRDKLRDALSQSAEIR